MYKGYLLSYHAVLYNTLLLLQSPCEQLASLTSCFNLKMFNVCLPVRTAIADINPKGVGKVTCNRNFGVVILFQNSAEWYRVSGGGWLLGAIERNPQAQSENPRDLVLRQCLSIKIVDTLVSLSTLLSRTDAD